MHCVSKAAERAKTNTVIFWKPVKITQLHTSNPKSGLEPSMSINDLEFAYAPVRDQVRDLREYL